MKNKSQKLEKLCSFYVSNWHLVTMLLPYINCKIDENVKIITILENEIQQNVKTLVEKLNLKNQEKILSIEWENFKSIKYNDIEQKLNNEINQNEKNIILINGSLNYIEKNNENVEKWLQKSKVTGTKIINFFEVTQFNNNILEILNTHDKVFNTSGEKEKSEVFEGYGKQLEVPTKKIVGDTIEE